MGRRPICSIAWLDALLVPKDYLSGAANGESIVVKKIHAKFQHGLLGVLQRGIANHKTYGGG